MPFEFDTVNEKWIVYKTFQEINDLTEINLSFWTFEIVLCVKWQGWASIWKESFTAELTRDFFSTSPQREIELQAELNTHLFS